MATSKREEERDRAEDGTGGRGRGAEREGPEREGKRREEEGPMTLWHGPPNVLIRHFQSEIRRKVEKKNGAFAITIQRLRNY